MGGVRHKDEGGGGEIEMKRNCKVKERCSELDLQ